MPYVNIRITRDGASAAQKLELITGVTDLLQRVLAKDPQSTFVVIDEVDTDNWGRGGESMTIVRQREADAGLAAAAADLAAPPAAT